MKMLFSKTIHVFGYFIFVCFLPLAKTAENVAPDPVLTIAVLDPEVDEKEYKDVVLNGGNFVLTCVDTDGADPGDAVRVYLDNVSPNSPCGDACFEVIPCGDMMTQFCVMFTGSGGILSHDSQETYDLEVVCTDDAEPEVSTVITVTVVSNTPPVFTTASGPVTVNGVSTGQFAVILDVDATDIDLDPITYSLSIPQLSDYIQIGQTDGKIRAVRDLRYHCDGDLSFQGQVSATDSINPSIPFITLDFTVSSTNERPTATNLDTTITIDENTALSYALALVDPNQFSSITSTFTVVPQSALSYLSFTPPNIALIAPSVLNYEESHLLMRTSVWSFQFYDGFCESEIQTLTININDVNERPTLLPEFIFLEVYEGIIDIPNKLTLLDEDLDDTHTWELIDGGQGVIGVEPNSGNIITVNDLDIDPNVEFRRFQNIEIRVTDQGGLTDTALISLTVKDANDNAPFFQDASYNFGATACTEPGSVIGNVQGDDLDSEFEKNNIFFFGGGGSKMAVMADGSVVLTESCIEGEGGTGSATIRDMGLYPSQLSGSNAVLNFVCGPCPPVTAAPAATTNAPGAGTTAAATTTDGGSGVSASSSSSSSSGGGVSDALPWIIPAAILGLIWLALLPYLIYKFCRPCKNPCPKRTPPPKPAKLVKPPPPPPPPVPYQPPPPPPKPKTPPPPIRVPTPEPEPMGDHLNPFWKETYIDQDQLQFPDRGGKPIPIESMPPDHVIPREGYKGPGPIDGPLSGPSGPGNPGGYQGPGNPGNAFGGAPDKTAGGSGKWDCVIL